MDGKPLISIVIPLYNTSLYMDKCLDTVINQSYRNVEIILIDDGSTDNTGKKCDDWAKKDERIKVVHRKNGGLSEARNTGIENAKGEYITFIDSDDYVSTDMVDYLYNLIVKYDTLMSLCTHTVMLSSGKSIINGKGGDEILSDKAVLFKMLYHDTIDTSAWGKLYHISLLNNIRYPKGKLFEDIGTTYKFFIASKTIACGYKDQYYYMVRDNSIVTSNFSPQKMDLLEMTDNMAKEVESIYPDLKKGIIRRQVYARFSTLNQITDYSLYLELVNELIEFITRYRMTVFFDINALLRDRLAILSLIFGKDVYCVLWNIYKKYLKGIL